MKESTFTSHIARYIRESFATPVVVVKHHDIVTAGVPDLSVSFQGRTIFFETKSVERLTELRKKIDQRQLAFLMLLERTGVPVWYVISYRLGDVYRIAVMSPHDVWVWHRTKKILWRTNRFGATLSDDLTWLVGRYVRMNPEDK